MIEQPIRTDSHMKDYEAHVTAVEADLEYYRTKRFESRLHLMIRRGVVTFYDLIKAAAEAPAAAHKGAAPTAGGETHPDHDHEALETRIRALEDKLDDYVREIAIIRSDDERELVIEDNRKERGDYDSFFRIAKRHYEGPIEHRIEQLDRDLDDGLQLLATLEQALIRSGRTTAAEMARRRTGNEAREHHNGARIVARAWVDPEFKKNLLELGREAVRELDIPPGRLGKLGVAEDTEDVHNVVVCTLCSCYPTDLLGNAPWWYRHDSYKENIVRDPRQTLRDMFSLTLPENVQVRVHDSTSDIRWMVLPKRPAGTEHLSEEQLAQLVTKDSLIGAGMALSPAEAGL
jgi:nitrile hydratase